MEDLVEGLMELLIEIVCWIFCEFPKGMIRLIIWPFRETWRKIEEVWEWIFGNGSD